MEIFIHKIIWLLLAIIQLLRPRYLMHNIIRPLSKSCKKFSRWHLLCRLCSQISWIIYRCAGICPEQPGFSTWCTLFKLCLESFVFAQLLASSSSSSLSLSMMRWWNICQELHYSGKSKDLFFQARVLLKEIKLHLVCVILLLLSCQVSINLRI